MILLIFHFPVLTLYQQLTEAITFFFSARPLRVISFFLDIVDMIAHIS